MIENNGSSVTIGDEEWHIIARDNNTIQINRFGAHVNMELDYDEWKALASFANHVVERNESR